MPKKSVEYDGEDAERSHPGAPFRTGSVSSCCFQLSFSRRMALIRRKPPCSKSFPEGSHFLGWVNIGIVRQGSLLQFGTFWRSIPAAELPEVGNEVSIMTISRFALSLILLASLPQQVHSPEDSPISFLPGESVTMTKTFCMRKSYYSLFLVPSSESIIS